MADYIPSGEAARIGWLVRFAGWFDLHGTDYGFTHSEVSTLVHQVDHTESAVRDSGDLGLVYRASVLAKREGIAAAITRSRDFVRRLQAQPGMTDAVRAEAGITVPDPTKTAVSPQAIEEITPPDVVLDFSKRLRVTVHFGLNPHNENQNAKPEGVHAAQIQYHRGGLPEHEADWQILDIDSASPYTHIVHEDEPATYAYRACWVDKKLNHGPYGDPAVCTVSV